MLPLSRPRHYLALSSALNNPDVPQTQFVVLFLIYGRATRFISVTCRSRWSDKDEFWHSRRASREHAAYAVNTLNLLPPGSPGVDFNAMIKKQGEIISAISLITEGQEELEMKTRWILEWKSRWEGTEVSGHFSFPWKHNCLLDVNKEFGFISKYIINFQRISVLYVLGIHSLSAKNEIREIQLLR